MALKLKKFIGTQRNARGELIAQYADPVKFKGTIAPRTTGEPGTAGYENRVTDQYVLYNYTIDISPKDIVVVNLDEFKVDGREFDFSQWNPITKFGGKQVALQRVVG